MVRHCQEGLPQRSSLSFYSSMRLASPRCGASWVGSILLCIPLFQPRLGCPAPWTFPNCPLSLQWAWFWFLPFTLLLLPHPPSVAWLLLVPGTFSPLASRCTAWSPSSAIVLRSFLVLPRLGHATPETMMPSCQILHHLLQWTIALPMLGLDPCAPRYTSYAYPPWIFPCFANYFILSRTSTPYGWSMFVRSPVRMPKTLLSHETSSRLLLPRARCTS